MADGKERVWKRLQPAGWSEPFDIGGKRTVEEIGRVHQGQMTHVTDAAAMVGRQGMFVRGKRGALHGHGGTKYQQDKQHPPPRRAPKCHFLPIIAKCFRALLSIVSACHP